MIKSQDIKEEVNNTNDRNLLRFGNKIINLSHVIEIGAEFDSKNRKIFFKYSDGSTHEEKYNNLALLSKSWEVVNHCIERGLFAVELTEECHAKWAKYSEEEVEREYRANNS